MRDTLAVLFLASIVIGRVLPAQAQTSSLSDSTDGDPNLACLYNTTGGVWTNPPSIPIGGSVMVNWSVRVPSGCSSVTQTLNGQSVPRYGSMTVWPPANATYTLKARFAGASRIVATASVSVMLPVDENGRPTVTITGNGPDQIALFLQGVSTDNAAVYVQNHVELDLSYKQDIPVHAGVTIMGGRTRQERGPRIFTRTFPSQLFQIGGFGVPGGNVRISGLRIEGAEMGVADSDTPGSTGISVRSWINVEIDNNEIYGWRGSGVEVLDDDSRIDRRNPMAVRIHNNFIHHNQHQLKDGYGVAVGNGAYALIEKNVFDWNRHAIAGDGSYLSGYLAHRNLVLEHGGLTLWVGTWVHTHMFDMHGLDDCGFGDRNCGPAGEYMDIRYNTFLYDAGHAFRLRGTPALWADVRDNVFKHASLWGVSTPYETITGALAQSESGLIAANNQLGVDESEPDDLRYCDFDADGVLDTFMATGATWWYASGGTAAWRYLNTSTRRTSQLTFGDVDGDRRCDVGSGSVISSGGTGPWRARAGAILWQHTDGRLALWSLNGGNITGEAYFAAETSDWQIRGTGDFNGDRDDDILWENTSGQLAIWHLSQLTPISTAYPGSASAIDGPIQAIGDFDGDGLADILRRDSTGQLAIYFKGNPYDAVSPAARPGYSNLLYREPVGLEWHVVGVGDFNGDGRSDILWRHDNSQVAIWYMAGGVRTGDRYTPLTIPTYLWTIAGVADFDGDGRADILWRDISGAVAIWLGGEAGGAVYPSYNNNGALRDLEWKIAGAADYNGDGHADILWRHNDGRVAIWFMAGGRFLREVYPRAVDPAWQIKGVFAHKR
jgi:FG-GAP-like repeat/Right handed beta helix region/FG-GAP repeat